MRDQARFEQQPIGGKPGYGRASMLLLRNPIQMVASIMLLLDSGTPNHDTLREDEKHISIANNNKEVARLIIMVKSINGLAQALSRRAVS